MAPLPFASRISVFSGRAATPWLAHTHRFYSEENFKTSFAQMYEALRPIEERIVALNLERINDTTKIDALLEKGLITPITAEFYREKITEQANAFS